MQTPVAVGCFLAIAHVIELPRIRAGLVAAIARIVGIGGIGHRDTTAQR